MSVKAAIFFPATDLYVGLIMIYRIKCVGTNSAMHVGDVQ